MKKALLIFATFIFCAVAVPVQVEAFVKDVMSPAYIRELQQYENTVCPNFAPTYECYFGIDHDCDQYLDETVYTEIASFGSRAKYCLGVDIKPAQRITEIGPLIVNGGIIVMMLVSFYLLFNWSRHPVKTKTKSNKKPKKSSKK